jgi:hypothetical protein
MCNTQSTFKISSTTLASYKTRQMKHLKYTSETLAKTLEKHLKTIANIHNNQIKHLQHMCETYANPDEHTCNIYLKKR